MLTTVHHWTTLDLLGNVTNGHFAAAAQTPSKETANYIKRHGSENAKRGLMLNQYTTNRDYRRA